MGAFKLEVIEQLEILPALKGHVKRYNADSLYLTDIVPIKPREDAALGAMVLE